MSLFVLSLFGLIVGFFDLFYLFIFMIFSVGYVSLTGLGGFFGGWYWLDSLSFFLVFMSIWIFVFCILASPLDLWVENGYLGYVLTLGSIFFLLYLSFTMFNFFLFYMCFEFIFVVMFLFLIGWGVSIERVQASFYMVFYTLVVSFPFLVFMTLWGSQNYSTSFMTVGGLNSLWSFFALSVFLVKLPVYSVHLWLPKAHVEAPVSGSMVLAGVLLKLGGYGMIRFSFFLNLFLKSYSGYLISLGLVGSFFSCVICLRQVDLKSFVAYSSVCHMGLGLAGLLSLTQGGLIGGILMMIGHGFVSSCLFFLLYLFYERFHSRSLFMLKGSLYLFPLVGFVWFVFIVLNMGVPPSLSFFSEIMIVTSLGSVSMFASIMVGLILLLGGVYGIYLYISSGHGLSILESFKYSVSIREYVLFYGHAFPVFFISLFMGCFI